MLWFLVLSYHHHYYFLLVFWLNLNRKNEWMPIYLLKQDSGQDSKKCVSNSPWRVSRGRFSKMPSPRRTRYGNSGSISRARRTLIFLCEKSQRKVVAMVVNFWKEKKLGYFWNAKNCLLFLKWKSSKKQLNVRWFKKFNYKKILLEIKSSLFKP